NILRQQKKIQQALRYLQEHFEYPEPQKKTACTATRMSWHKKIFSSTLIILILCKESKILFYRLLHYTIKQQVFIDNLLNTMSVNPELPVLCTECCTDGNKRISVQVRFDGYLLQLFFHVP